jgi:hypothetical protein
MDGERVWRVRLREETRYLWTTVEDGIRRDQGETSGINRNKFYLLILVEQLKLLERANKTDKLTGELLCPPPDVAEGEFVENPRLTLGAIL